MTRGEGAEQPDGMLTGHLPRMADGLDVLIRLHDRELDRELLQSMAQHRIAEGLNELLESEEGLAAARELQAALEEIGPAPSDAALDGLASEYADIYLTHAYRSAPNGSVWLTDEHLERQLPMFAVREWYDHYGISVPDWRLRADDHLVHELQFVAFLLRQQAMVPARDAARFMDLHLLPWLPEFCTRARKHATTRFYRAVLDLTRAFADDLRQSLAEITGEPRAVRSLPDPGQPAKVDQDRAAFVPGMSASW